MKWTECSMFDAILHASDRMPINEAKRPELAAIDEDVVVFTDGTAIACHSDFADNSYSEYTPEITAHDPKWRVFR